MKASNVGAVPLCPPVGWLGGVRLFVDELA